MVSPGIIERLASLIFGRETFDGLNIQWFAGAFDRTT
jgi:hypothetical protein